MKAWLQNLNTRDRRALGIGSVVVLVAAIYALLWQPLHVRHQRAQEVVEEQRILWRWMQSAAGEARALGAGDQPQTQTLAGQSLLATIDRTVGVAHLKDSVKRIEPDGADRVRVWVEQAAFDSLIEWLGGLEQTHGIRVADIRVEPKGRPGQVGARLTLEGGTP